MKIRYIVEDALKLLHEREYEGGEIGPDELVEALGLHRKQAEMVQKSLREAGLLTEEAGRLRLSDSGRKYARQVLRAHRLLETYMAQYTSEDIRHWHKRADKQEHSLSTMDVEDMDARLNFPRFDPHGDPIPSRRGTLPVLSRVPLADCECGFEGLIEHIEDEPEGPYARLVQHGLAPGMTLRVDEHEENGLWVSIEGRRLRFDAEMCKQVHVRAGQLRYEGEQLRLSEIDEDDAVDVIGILPSCRGAERDRLLDLGVVPGSRITLELNGPHGDPRAYKIREAVIALRRAQAEQIQVRPAASTTGGAA